MPAPKPQLPPLDFPSPETDTLVYLHSTPPSHPLRCSSQKLLATGSPVFTRLLGPTAQYRLLRRKNLLKLGLPMGIKFVVDLSPPSEGEEAVAVVENLWCPDEVLAWRSKLTGTYYEEDEETLLDPWIPVSVRAALWKDTKSQEINSYLDREKELELEAEENRKKAKLVAYSPTRHTAAIERILHILHGLDPQIHTTPMWYTVYKVALQLECMSAVQDHIISWIYGNVDFIELHPAFVMQISNEIKCADLFRDAFAILVGKQLLGGRMSEGGVFIIGTIVPPAAQPWAKNIIHARKSLQTRLERLYSYISSTAWLDNAQVIPEYKKLTVHLTVNEFTSPELQARTVELDNAIRANLKTLLGKLFEYSEDPGDPNWMNPWEKAVFDMLPGHHQIFSRMYWRQLAHIPDNPYVFDEKVKMLLHLWGLDIELEARHAEFARVQAEQERMQAESVAVGLWREQQEFNEKVMLGRPERFPEINSMAESSRKGKEIANTCLASESPEYNTQALNYTSNPQLPSASKEFWRCMSAQTKDILKPTKKPAASALDPRPILPPITRADSDTLPSINTLLRRLASLPPAYDFRDTLPDYAELALSGVDSPEPKIGAKRKSLVDDSDTDSDDLEIRCKGEDPEGGQALLLPRAERIEIANPQRKRRCSVEREEDDDDDDDDDENLTEAHGVNSYIKEEEGEPEMFKISGVYEDVEPKDPFSLQNISLAFEETAPLGLAFDNAMAQAEAEPLIKYEGWSAPAAQSSIFANPDPTPQRWMAANGAILTRVIDDDDDDGNSYWRHAGNISRQLRLRPTITPFNAIRASSRENTSSPHSWATAPDIGRTEAARMVNLPGPEKLNLYQLWKECLAYLHTVGAESLKVPISFEPVLAGDAQLLVCLRELEWQFCPLWAGGLDDGSGGVYGEKVEKEKQVEVQTEAEKGMGRQVELEVRGPLQVQEPDEVGSVGDYDDCRLDSESIASFSTGGFSFGVVSDFEDSESEVETIAGDTESESGTEAGSESEIESQSTTEAGDSDDASSDGFEEIDWETVF